MNVQTHSRLLLVALLLICVALSSCGGGGGGSTGGSSNPGGGGTPQILQIITDPILPNTLQGSAYTATLTATGGHGALHWSIAPISPTAMFVTGLTIDAASGVLSGTANFGGTGGFTATVTDSDSHTATKSFTVTAYMPLSAPASKSFTQRQYIPAINMGVESSFGVPPLTFSVTGGSLPPGMHLDSSTGKITGAPYILGSYVATVTIKDSWAPQEVVTEQVLLSVLPLGLELTNSLPTWIPVNAPFNGRMVARGGTPPYTFLIDGGALPDGLAVEAATGAISGTPTTLQSSWFSIRVTDSASPAQTVSRNYGLVVANGHGRNDTPTTATPFDVGTYTLSLSPYIDPPNKAPLPNDTDYIKLTSLSGSTVHVEANGGGAYRGYLLDTVLEFVDGNGVRLTTCRQPGDTSTNFTSICINDDAGASTLDSALDIQVPGAPSTATTFYAHVLDWRGDARPDMSYGLVITGIVRPLSLSGAAIIPAARGNAVTRQIYASSGKGPLTYSIAAGALPPGLSLSADGVITGAATTAGSYAFTVQVLDSSTPPQVATANFTMQIVEPFTITSPATWPDACLNQPYSFAVQYSGGGWQPNKDFYWTSSPPSGIIMQVSTLVASGTPTATGTFTGRVSVTDYSTSSASQNISLTVKNCP